MSVIHQTAKAPSQEHRVTQEAPTVGLGVFMQWAAECTNLCTTVQSDVFEMVLVKKTILGIKLDAFNPSTKDVGMTGSGVQGYP